MRNLLFFLGLIFSQLSFAQPCDGPGQTPARAFPVCGSTTFHQNSVPECVTVGFKVPGCNDGANYQDKNPYWYRFTCYQPGTLGFLIKPTDQGDDYDWQLFDITGREPEDVYTDQSMIVTGNWAGTPGNTGASNAGVDFIQCASQASEMKNTFAKMPQLQEGHIYLLMVSHYDGLSQSGYDLSFGGGTAVITDPTIPELKTAEAACSGDLIRIKLSKKIKCSSIAADGSDFYVTPAGSVTSATGVDCSIYFDTDSLIIKLNSALAPGTYQLHIKKGTDGNTLLDACDNSAKETDVISFTVLPITPVPMDSLAPVSCATKQLRLIFDKPIACNSIAADGSDFIINGSYAVLISKAEGVCNAGTTKEILVTLSEPLTSKGSFTIVLRRGSDGNTLLDECSIETPAGSSLPFAVKDTVNADFSYTIDYSCTEDVVHFQHDGFKEVNSWKWNLDDGQTSNLQSATGRYTTFTQKNIELIVSNGFCSDTTRQVVMLDNYLKVDFTSLPDHCPNEPMQFTSTAEGKIIRHNWAFGDGNSSDLASPTHSYKPPQKETKYSVQYTVTDSYGCQKTATKPVTIYSSCTVYVPNAFTPGNDGVNDWFRVLNAVKVDQFQLNIYNRWGQLLFETKNWKQGWDGRFRGQLQPGGTYIWMVHYVDGRNGKTVEQKGTFVLIR